YLVLGGMLAASMQTFLPQSTIVAIGSSTVTSVPVMMLLAAVLSICSTVDSFVALSFLGTFTSGAVLAFLVFGPMIDIKSSLMYSRVFRPRAVAALIAVVTLGSFLTGVVYNYYLR
ncbi:MAG: permease, partial [Deinococcus sp.]|nr:permease [Deinococcus sp.]